MNESANEKRLEPLAVDHAPAASEGNIRCRASVDFPIVEIDNKENLYTGSTSRYDLASLPHAPTQCKTAKKGERCHTRKSLAWNQAFFTDEGVLDSSELSILCGSATKSSISSLKGSSFTETNGDISPLRSCDISTRANSLAEMQMRSALRYENPSESRSALKQQKRMEDARTNEVPEKALMAINNCRIPRAPSTLKRTANLSTNAPSKLPKFTAITPHTSSVSSSVKCNTPANFQNHNLKPAKADVKKDLICLTKSAKESEPTINKRTVNVDSGLPLSVDTMKHTNSLGKPQNQVTSTSFSAITASSLPHNSFHHNPAGIQPRASGLKMPTPSLGFFCSVKSRPFVQKESQNTTSIRERFGYEHTIRKDMGMKPSNRKTCKDKNEFMVSSCLKDAQEELQSFFSMDESNMEKERVKDGQVCRSESSKSVDLYQEYGENLSECTRMEPLQVDDALGESRTYQQEVDSCETSSPDLSRGLVDHHKLLDGCSSIEVETSLRSVDTQMDVNASLILPSSTSENIILPEATIAKPVKPEQKDPEILDQENTNKMHPMEKSKDPPILLNQLTAAPFSDEWIAALETLGEDILQVKSGAVQNSPQEKPNSEPSPWSPVKRKNPDVGPYDCTKYTKNLSIPHTSP